MILLSFEDRLLWFHDTINIGRAFLSFLNRSGVAWSENVALLLCWMRFSNPIEHMDYRQRQQLHDFAFTSKTKQQNVGYTFSISFLFAPGYLETILTSPDKLS